MNDERIKEIYTALETLVVELDPDPNSRGPGYLQDLIAKTRGFLNQTSFYLTEVLREIQTQEMETEALEAAFQVASDELMANNRQVSALPAVQDRLAMINVMLAQQRREIITAKRTLKNLSHVERVVRHRHKELENTMSAIRLQRSLLETEIRTGSFYGDEGDQSRGSRWKTSGGNTDEEGFSSDEIERLMREAEAGTTEVNEDTACPAPPPADPLPPADPPPALSAVDQEIADLLETAEQSGAFEEPQPVVVKGKKGTNGSGSKPAPVEAKPAPVEEDDPDIKRFLTQEEDDTDLFKDL